MSLLPPSTRPVIRAGPVADRTSRMTIATACWVYGVGVLAAAAMWIAWGFGLAGGEK